MSPLLFLIYINDLVKILKSCEIILFADDTNIFVSGGTQELAFTTAQEILNTISNYMNCNKLHVNLEKSCYMYFNNTRKSENVEKLNNFVLKISNTSLPQVKHTPKHTKFLGVIIDNKLTWQPHLSSLVKNCPDAQEDRIAFYNSFPQTTTQTFITPYLKATSRMENQSGEVLNLPS